jgi:DNA-binding transcriptional regulator GbsR (MarR family)
MKNVNAPIQNTTNLDEDLNNIRAPIQNISDLNEDMKNVKALIKNATDKNEDVKNVRTHIPEWRREKRKSSQPKHIRPKATYLYVSL